MKVFNTQTIKFVMIDTDIGEFRVSSFGIEKWNYDIMDYSWIEESDYEDDVYSELKRIAEEKLK